MNVEFVIEPCFLCKTVPKIKEHHQEDGLRALYIDCPGCFTHGPFKHIHEHGYEKAAELCAEDWNIKQRMFKDGII